MSTRVHTRKKHWSECWAHECWYTSAECQHASDETAKVRTPTRCVNQHNLLRNILKLQVTALSLQSPVGGLRTRWKLNLSQDIHQGCYASTCRSHHHTTVADWAGASFRVLRGGLSCHISIFQQIQQGLFTHAQLHPPSPKHSPTCGCSRWLSCLGWLREQGLIQIHRDSDSWNVSERLGQLDLFKICCETMHLWSCLTQSSCFTLSWAISHSVTGLICKTHRKPWLLPILPAKSGGVSFQISPPTDAGNPQLPLPPPSRREVKGTHRA